MGLRAIVRHLFRDRDPLDPLDFDLRLDAEPDQLNHPVQFVVMNDERTPMDFVVKILRTYLRQEKDVAIEAMLMVHTRGEHSVAVLEKVEADKLIAKVEIESKERGYPLVCEARPL